MEVALGHHAAGDTQRDVQDHRSLRQLKWPHGGRAQVASVDNCLESAAALRTRLRPTSYPANRRLVSLAQYERYFKFAVVRNPWARAFSWYQNVMTDPLHRRRLRVPADAGFGDFVHRFAGADLLRPQSRWIVDFDGRIGVDLVCRFENLARDFQQACERANLPAVPLPHVNHAAGGRYLDAYDDRTRRVIADRFEHEIDLFGYAFDT